MEEITYLNNIGLNAWHLVQLAKYCPNLREITFGGGIQIRSYLLDIRFYDSLFNYYLDPSNFCYDIYDTSNFDVSKLHFTICAPTNAWILSDLSEAGIAYDLTYTPLSDDNAWKQAYIDFIKERVTDASYYENCEYTLAYIDDDAIPELYIDTQYSAGGQIIYSFKNGELHGICTDGTGYDSYIERQSLVLNEGGRYDWGFDEVIQLNNGIWEILGKGETIIKTYPDSDDINWTESQFTWNDIPVSKDEYYKQLNSLFDRPRSQWIDGKYTFDEIIKVIENY